jgi:hypothetical protein
MKPFFFVLLALSSASADVIDIGSRRELFVDDFLIEKMTGKAEQRLHHPQAKEIAITHDAPWEGSGTGYHSVFKDGDKYRMYYKAWQLTVTPPGKVNTGEHPLFTCYAESDDGIHWRKPELGLHEFKGTKANNIVLAPGKMGAANPDPGHIAIFKDDNPAAKPEARYKAIVRSGSPKGLLAMQSADGLHWSPMQETPVITDGAFDSQNLAFWDANSGVYRAYWRYFTGGTTDEKNWKPSGDRAIRTATSKDFLHWENQHDLSYTDSPSEQLYTNQVKPYHRAPQLLLGFPTRYVERGWSPSMKALPELEHREWRAKANQRYGTAITEGLFMASRDGVKFKRWNDAFLPPGIEREGTWNYGQQYIAWHLVETKSALEGAPNDLSLYAGENYWTGTSSPAPSPHAAPRRFRLHPRADERRRTHHQTTHLHRQGAHDKLRQLRRWRHPGRNSGRGRQAAARLHFGRLRGAFRRFRPTHRRVERRQRCQLARWKDRAPAVCPEGRGLVLDQV